MAHDADRSDTSDRNLPDGLGPENVYTRRAYIWFVGSLLFSFALTFVLSGIDRAMYDSEAPYLDEAKYRENRQASTSIPSESNDQRKGGSLSSAIADLNQ